MRVIVIGAGVVGTATALQLARQGCEVVVLESGKEAASGASHANAGLLSPGHAFSWAAPGVLKNLGRIVAGRDEGLGIASWMDPTLWSWAMRFLRECRRSRWHANSQAAITLSAYSRSLMREHALPPATSYCGERDGILYLYGGASGCDQDELALLDACKERYEHLGEPRLHEVEPMLAASKQPFRMGVYCPDDATGDARLFTAAAVLEAARLGAVFAFDEPVERLVSRNGSVEEVWTGKRMLEADAIVLATGVHAADLARPLGYSLPIYPVTGYSVTYDHPGDDGIQPRVGAVSVQHKIAWASFGNRVRFTGYADIGIPRGEARPQARFEALERFARSVYGPAVRTTPRRWMGQRPMTPDGLPVVGASGHGKLFFNCGHGAMGWTMACGSARLLCDAILAEPSAIDRRPYRWDRF